jgi:hypothetical protein
MDKQSWSHELWRFFIYDDELMFHRNKPKIGNESCLWCALSCVPFWLCIYIQKFALLWLLSLLFLFDEITLYVNYLFNVKSELGFVLSSFICVFASVLF